MAAVATRFVCVSLHPQGQELKILLVDGTLSIETLQSQFPNASGLKYNVNGCWNAVPLHNSKFSFPEENYLFIVVTGTLDRSRQILGSNSLASQVATTFRSAPPESPSALTYTPCNRVSRHVRKRIGSVNVKPRSTKIASKTYKVVFVKHTDLPTNFSKGLVLLEGIITVNLQDDEVMIMNSLKSMLEASVINAEEIQILSYASKRLSVPCSLPGFRWNGQQLKANIGQGKLYVMASGYKESLSGSSSTDSLPELVSSAEKKVEEQRSGQNVPDDKAPRSNLTAIDSDTRREKFLSEHGDWITDQGIPNVWRLSIDNRQAMADLLIKQFVYYRTSMEIQQFIRGMDDIGQFWKVVKANASVFKPLFCHQQQPITKNEFESLCNMHYSEEGSNKRIAEDETTYSWEMFLQDICGNPDESIPVTYEELLAFITGADKIPPCGFSKPIDVSFYQKEYGVQRLPHVSTCSLELFLPRGSGNHKEFSAIFIRALKESLGFEKM